MGGGAGGRHGKISNEQRAAELAVWQTSLHNPDFAAYARLCGAWGRCVERREDLEEGIAGARAHPGPALLEVVADPDLV